MIMLDRGAVAAALPWPALLEALAVMFRQGCEAPLRHRHAVGQDGTLLLMPAWQTNGFCGVKIVQVNPGNAALGAPAVNATYLLSRAGDGVPVALLDGGELTDRRTAAASALAARHLARPDSARLMLLGSGRVAAALAECHASVFPLTDIMVWSPRTASAERLVAKLVSHGMPARAVPAPIFDADIISAATLSAVPLIRGAALRNGTHLDLVGAYRPDMREADGAALARATLVVDTYPGAMAEAGDIVQGIAERAFRAEHVVADLAALCRGQHPGRTGASEITVFKSVGWAGEDLAAAMLAAGYSELGGE